MNEISDALKIISSTISKCEKMLAKFSTGTSQNTLLQNRLQAMYISKELILAETHSKQYSREDYANALKSVDSILNKCKAAQRKHAIETPVFKRLQKIINSMNIAKMLIEEEVNKMG